MKELVENIDKQITSDKEVISILPRNGIKAIKNLLETLTEMKEKYSQFDEDLLKEIEKRFKSLTDVEENPKISQLGQEIIELDTAIKNTDTRSSFEKMRLDKILYNVNGYYKSNLERLNKELINCVKQFEKVGIKLTYEDFSISEYSQNYMKVLLEEAYNGEINSERIKTAFEKEYWKCSEVVSHLYANIRYLYEKYENEIDKFYDEKSEKIFKQLEENSEQVEERKSTLIIEKKRLEDIDNKIILSKFFNGILNVNDYKEKSYQKNYMDLFSKDVTKISDKEKREEAETIEKLNSNLFEYSKYVEYKFLVDGILDIRKQELEKQEKEAKNAKNKKNKKTEYVLIKDEIKKTVSEIFKTNNKLSKKTSGIFKKDMTNTKKYNMLILQRNNMILELKKLYMRQNELIINNIVMKNIDETSSILDVLKIASNHYDFMAKEIIKNNDEITDKELGIKAGEIRDFITFSNFAVLNHVKISDKKDISVIIKDKYKLFGMQISKENFEEGSIDDLIRKTNIINNYNNIQKSKFSVNDIEYIMSTKELLKK